MKKKKQKENKTSFPADSHLSGKKGKCYPYEPQKQRTKNSTRTITLCFDPYDGHGRPSAAVKLPVKATTEQLLQLGDYIQSDPQWFLNEFLQQIIMLTGDASEGKEPRGKNIKKAWIMERLKRQSARMYVIASYWFDKDPRKWTRSFGDLLLRLNKAQLAKKLTSREENSNLNKPLYVTKVCMTYSYLGRLAFNSYGITAIDKLKDSEFYRTYVSPYMISTKRFFENIEGGKTIKGEPLMDRHDYTKQWIDDLSISIRPPQKP